MKAVVVRRCGPMRAHRIAERADPVPGPGQVLIDVEATDTNYPDLLVVK